MSVLYPKTLLLRPNKEEQSTPEEGLKQATPKDVDEDTL